MNENVGKSPDRVENAEWQNRLQALGHTVKLMPPSYVKAYRQYALPENVSGCVPTARR